MAKDDCICMAIGWPDTTAKGAEPIFSWLYDKGIIKDVYFKVGHAALCLIRKKDGLIEYYDFGRYTCDHGQGRPRGRNTDPNLEIKVKARFDENGEMANIQELVDYLFTITRYTHGEGVIYFSLYDKMDYGKAQTFISGLQEQGSVRYTTFSPNSTNCSRFVCGTLLAGSSSTMDKWKLVLTPTFKASPVGNAVDVGYQSNVYRQTAPGKPLENFKMTRLGNLKLLWDNIKGNFIGDKIVRKDKIEEGEKHLDIPKKAQWLGGLGEGNWITVTPLLFDGEECFRATAQYEDGVLNYDTIVKVKEGAKPDPLQPFEITYDCSRLFVTILQKGSKFRLYHLKDYQDVDKNLIRIIEKSTTSWT